jgi:bifunctional UDP-N-acetylglucosamine pyrophosphorylase/glucosamine-1-phosphate N-acetyltransferase
MGNALETVENMIGDCFLAVNADDIYEPRLVKDLLHEHEKNPTGLSLVVRETDTPWKYGVIDIDGDIPKRIIEKPERGKEPSNLAVMGIYLLTPEIFGFLSKIPVSDHQLENAYQTYISRGDVKLVKYDGYFSSFKYPWDILDINRYLMHKTIKGQNVHPSVKFKHSEKVVIDGNVRIEEGVNILEYAVIRGPCYIGRNSVIGNHTLIRQSSIGENCCIGSNTEIVRSIIGDNSEFHMAFVGDSIIGKRCWFGAGTVTANLRLDRSPIKVEVNNEKILTDRDKLGVITGDDVYAGTNTQFRPGTIVGSNVWIDQNLTVQGNILSSSFIENGNTRVSIREKH